MVERYFYSQGDAEAGPFSARQMRELAAAGQIRGTDFVWQEGSGQRHPACRVRNLFFPALPGGAPATAPAAELAPVPPPAPEPAADVAAPEAEPVVEPEVAPPAAKPPAFVAKRRVKRVTSITGGILFSQDGTSVKFCKKCSKCDYVDGSRSSTPIRTGSMRVPFFCPKCRQARTVVIQAIG